MTILRVIEFALDILFPRFCVACRREGSFLCDSCRRAVQIMPPRCFVCEIRSPDGETCLRCRNKSPIKRFYAPLNFHDRTARELVHTLKYGGAKEIARILAEHIGQGLAEYRISIPRNAILIPIPLHKTRLRERGFNQAEVVAAPLAAASGAEVNTSLLTRPIYRKRQTEMPDRESRVGNVEGAYQANGIAKKDRLYILVDDVTTTGATLDEAARVLKKAGARQIWAITAAR